MVNCSPTGSGSLGQGEAISCLPYSCPGGSCPYGDSLGAELNPTAGAEAMTSSVALRTVAIKVSEGTGVTMKLKVS